MPLSVRTRVENEIAILDLEGTLTLGPTLQNLREIAKQALADHRPKGVVLGVAGLAAVDSAGLGELTVVYTLCSRQGCPIALAGPGQNLRTMLEVTHLDGLLPSADSVSSARTLVARQ
jgi:anti-anti-sigma factor